MTTEPASRRVPDATRRSRTFLFRCNPVDAALIEQAATDLGCSLSDLLRDAAVTCAREQVDAA